MKTGWRVAEGWKDSIEVIKTNQGPDLSPSKSILYYFLLHLLKAEIEKSPFSLQNRLNYFNILNKQAIRKENLLEWVVCR